MSAAKAVETPIKFKPLISNAKMWQVYTDMLKAQLFDARVESSSVLGEVQGVRTGLREEAMLAALIGGLGKRDILVARKHDLNASLLRGRSIASVLGQALTRDDRSTRAVVQASEDATLFTGATAEMATFAAGVATGAQTLPADGSSQRITLALLGNVTSASTIETALRIAGHTHLPLILVFRSNGTKRAVFTRETLHGVPHIPVDGQDAVAMMRVAQEAVGRARTGIGSVLVECRFLPGLPAPVAAMKQHLEAKNLWDEARNHQIETAFAAELNISFRAMQNTR